MTLNAPTAAVKAICDPPISYVDEEAIYHVSIVDTTPNRDENHQYHTVVRVCVDETPQQRSSRQSPLIKQSAKAHICTVEYSPLPQQNGNSPHILPALHSSLEQSFSVTWSSSAVTGGSYCLIPIKFRNLSRSGNVSLKLFVGTERIQIIDATLSRAEQYEESFACVRLFSGGDAQITRAAEVVHVEHKILDLQNAIEQANVALDETKLAQKSTDDALASNIKAEKGTTKKRKASIKTDSVCRLTKEYASLANKLSFARKSLSSVRPVQVFRPVVSVPGEQPQFHMPSQQTKYSIASPQIIRKDKGSKNAKAEYAPTDQKVMERLDQSCCNTNNLNSKIPAIAAKAAEKRRPTSVACFYVRPEHLPNANYIAIYLSRQDFPSLLSAIASKLHVHVGTIGTIYYYDQRMTPVVVNEKTVGTIIHEQDLIVRLPNVANNVPELCDASKLEVPFTGGFCNNHPSIFDQYLAMPLEDCYGTSVDSLSEFADDTSISMSQMFARCSTAMTTLSSDDGMYYEKDHVQPQFVLGEQGIDYANYAFDATSNVAMPTICLSSAPTPSTLQLSATTPEPRQIFAPQAKTLQMTAIEERFAIDAVHSVKDETEATKAFPPRCSPPVSRTRAAKRPTSLRNYKALGSMRNSDIDSDNSRPSQTDNEVVNALERNRLAAMKCRITRKEKEARLQELSREKSEVNAELKKEIRHLEAEIAEAKGLLKMHVGCL